MTVMDLARAERQDLLELLARLSPEQWAARPAPRPPCLDRPARGTAPPPASLPW